MPVPRPEEDQALQGWLKQSLIQRYSSTLREPIPEAMLRLFDEERS